MERGSVKPSVARKIIDALRDILDRIRHGSASLNAAEELGLTEQEIRKAMDKLSAVAKAAGEKENAAREGGGVKYSIKRTSTMTLSEQLRAYYNGKMASSDAFYFGQTPETLSAANLDALPLAFTITDFKKSTREKHNVPRRVLNNLLSDLETPLFAFVDGDRVGVVTDDIDGDGKQLLVGIQAGATMDRLPVNVIQSVYGLDAPREWLNNQIKAGNKFILFDEKRANTFLQTYGYLASVGDGIRSLESSISHDDGKSNTPKTSLDETREYKRELERMKRRADHQAEAEKIKRESAQLVGSARAELRASVGRDVESRLRASGAPDSMAEPLTRLLLEERVTDAQRALLNAEPAAQEIMKQYAVSEPEPVARARAKLAEAEAAGVSRLLELAEAGRTGYNAIKETGQKEGESYGREEQDPSRGRGDQTVGVSASRTDGGRRETYESSKGEVGEAFRRRIDASDGLWKIQKHGSGQVAYRPIKEDAITETQKVAAELFYQCGVEVILTDGPYESCFNGRVSSGIDAITVGNCVYISNLTEFDPDNIFRHEIIHVMKNVLPDLYDELYDSFCSLWVARSDESQRLIEKSVKHILVNRYSIRRLGNR